MSVTKFLGAALLTFAVVGGTGAYLNSTLKTATPIHYNSVAAQVQHIGTHPVVTVTEARAS